MAFDIALRVDRLLMKKVNNLLVEKCFTPTQNACSCLLPAQGCSDNLGGFKGLELGTEIL